MSNKKAIIFGAGPVGKHFLPYVRLHSHVLCFVDNDSAKWGTLEGLPVCAPGVVTETDFDVIVVATLSGLNSVTDQLLSLGVERDKINTDYVDASVRSRIVFLEKLGEIFRERDICGCVAEGGVFLGEFSKEINRVFPTKRLYLFDTFCGFDERDLAIEQERMYSEFGAGHFGITSEEIVMSKLPHPEMCVIRKGYFPETAEGIDETFCFVNLDFDLYQPTLAGLEFFYPRMVDGGIILVHDYFADDSFRGVRAAVNNFEAQTEGLRIFPIGDGLSVGLV